MGNGYANGYAYGHGFAMCDMRYVEFLFGDRDLREV
jgi:hypothetical protein